MIDKRFAWRFRSAISSGIRARKSTATEPRAKRANLSEGGVCFISYEQRWRGDPVRNGVSVGVRFARQEILPVEEQLLS